MKTMTQVGATAANAVCEENDKSQVNTGAALRPRFGNPDMPEDCFARVVDLRMHQEAHAPAMLRRKYLNILIDELRCYVESDEVKGFKSFRDC
ncbi:MAG: hypothetical protein NT118_16165 [Lentisphaerae bacterium]|nr:hypothetical protein [Lentisphaerota bacterium]